MLVSFDYFIVLAMPPGWIPISSAHEQLVDTFLSDHDDPYAYESSWAFVRQETRLVGHIYAAEELLIITTQKDAASPFLFVLPPLGSRSHFIRRLGSLGAVLSSATGKRIVFRKLALPDCQELTRLYNFRVLAPSEFLLPRDVPEDIYPQVIISVQDALQATASCFRKIRGHIRRFQRSHYARVERLSSPNVADVRTLVQQWKDDYDRRPASGGTQTTVDGSAFTLFADEFAHRVGSGGYFGEVLYSADQPVGFAFAARTNERTAALYSNIALTSFHGAPEYLMQALLGSLNRAGIQLLNLGGAETEGLHQFKVKYRPVHLRHTFDLEYVG